MLPLCCLHRWYNVFSERFTIHCIPSWLFNTFFFFSRLKSHLTKRGIAGIEALNGVQLDVCGIKCINLRNEAIKVLGTYFSCKKKRWKKNLTSSQLFPIVSKLSPMLKLGRFGNLILDGEIVALKSLAI